MSNPTPITVNENKASAKYIDRNPPLATDPDLNRKVVDYLAYLKEILNFSVATTGKRITDTSGYVNELVRTSNSLISTIYDTQNGLVSKVEQNANSIALVVDSTTDTINAASIVAAINGSGSTVQINADHIELTGYVKFTNLSTAGEATINGGNIQANTLTLTSFDSTAQAALITGTTVKNRYYLSTSSSSATGGSWSDTVPAWSSGKYVWTRVRTTKTFANGTSSSSDSTAVYDANLTSALSTAAAASTAASNAATAAGTAQTTANGALASTVSCYYRSTSSTTPTISTSTSIGTAVDTSNAWEYVLPRPKNGCYFFTCEKYTTKGGTVSFSTVRQIANATYTSLWCSASDATYIDGGHIYAGSVTADRIKANETFTQKLYAQDFNITGGSINITTASATSDNIVLNYGTYKMWLTPSAMYFDNTNSGERLLLSSSIVSIMEHIPNSPNNTYVGVAGLGTSSSGGSVSAGCGFSNDGLSYFKKGFINVFDGSTTSPSISLTGETGKVKLNKETASRALILNANKQIEASSVTSTELGYLSGVTSNIQTQINNITVSATRINDSTTFTPSTSYVSKKSFTIPAGKYFCVSCKAWMNGGSGTYPTGIVLASSSTVGDWVTLAEDANGTNKYQKCVTYCGYVASATTFYIWVKANNTSTSIGVSYDGFYL